MKKLFAILTICLGCCGILAAQNIWKPINIPGTLLGVSSDGSIFAYSDYFDYGEIALSQDEGETWQVVLSSETEPNISFLYNMEHGFTISEDGRAFVVAEHQVEGYLDYYCLFYSDDNGGTWQQTTEIPYFLASGMVEFGGIVAPTNDLIVAWSSGGDYIWTIDGGETWNYAYFTPPHDGIPGHLPHELCNVIVNASGDIYASYLLYSDSQAAIARTDISHMSSWEGREILDCTEIWDMEFDPDGNAFMGYIRDTIWSCGEMNYYQGDGYYVFAGQSIAISDNGVVYKLRYLDDTHVVLNYSQNDANNFFDVGEVMEIQQPYSSLFRDGNIYKGHDNHLYFFGNSQYWKSIPDANDIPSLNGWIGTCFFDEASSLWYCITDNNTVEVTSSNGIQYQGSFVIPETVSYMGTTYTVVGIGNRSFCGLSEMTLISIPETVTYIGDEAFYYCSGLDSINIPNSMISIGKKAFFTCEGLESIYIPNSVTSIGTGAFRECYNLKSVHLPDSLEVIESYLFYLCYELRSITFPESLKEIKRDAFYSCTQLSEIVIPKNVERIDVEAFWYCTNLSRIELGLSLNYIADKAFLSYFPGETITVICHNPIPAQCSTSAFPSAQYQEMAIVPCGCEEAYRSAWAECWQSGNFEEDCDFVGSEWYYEILNDDGSITYQHLECVADTTIGSQRPKIIIRSNTQYDKDLITEVTHEYIYEENGKVYWWNKDLEEFTTLYDLAAEVGDEWEIMVGMESISVHVDDVDAFEYEGETFKRLHISDVGNLFNGDIVVGFGHMTSFFPERLMRKNADFEVNGLRCYWVEDALLYHNGDEDCDAVYDELHGVDDNGPSTGSGTLMVYPNPADGVVLVRLPQCDSPTTDKTEYRITNLMGQTLLQGHINAENQQINIENLPSGMYFITLGGQTVKFVVK